MVSFWGRKNDDPERTESFQGQQDGDASAHEYNEPTERTRLLGRDNSQGYLSPDDPAVRYHFEPVVATDEITHGNQVSPYNLWSVRALRAFSLFALAISFVWWTFLLVSIFVTPPLMHSRGPGFFAFSYTTLATGYLVLGLLFFAVPSKPVSIWGSLLFTFLLVNMIIILAVPRIRLEEGWVGIASVVWAAAISLYQLVQNRAVAWGKREEEERLTGREETRRSLQEWGAVLIEMVVLVVLTIAAILFTATLVLRARDVSLASPGHRYSVHGDTYQVHLACFGNRTEENADQPTVLLEGGDGPVEHSLQPFIDDAHQHGLIGRYCYWDRPGLAWSDNAPSPHSAGMASDALSEALALADETGPWVVVSAGVGSLYSRLFASRHLLEVTGIFLIDPLHEAYLEDLGRPSRGFVLWLRGVISPLGLDRLAGALVRGRSREDRVIGRSAYQSGKFIKAKLQENLVALTMTAAEVQSARHVQMGETPLVVVSSGVKVNKDPQWAKRQEELSRITNKLLSWDVVHDAPHEVWTNGEGRQVLEKRLREILQKGQANRA
ncbi:uncharacterized protein N7459_007803 [Penicillium hispanicum]|uniref:uncharacterized protein n=1 Tax=Penicillium hispanicum TaxID=1080232 RepID=UPI0025416AC1|nr:uncharacterized protein N7459_007803 [Penicillium hispanicum]KAJ5573376.1 hypothetical protein N7459_007803 [Penicillium hispanicum]